MPLLYFGRRPFIRASTLAVWAPCVPP
jgi:hypothetical protein